MNRCPAGLLFLFVAALACVPGPAHACQCGTKPRADVALAQSQVVVAGVVTAVENVRVTLFPDSSSPLPAVVPRATLKVQKRWKGPAACMPALGTSNLSRQHFASLSRSPKSQSCLSRSSFQSARPASRRKRHGSS
jgi:hypothetical protein